MHAEDSIIDQAPPWYAQRWPWLLMLGPALVLVGGATAAWLAVSRPDALVVGDYYKQGKAINQDLKRDRVASTLRIGFEARYDPVHGRLEGSLESFGLPLSRNLRVLLAHPTQPEKDRTIVVQSDGAGRFSVALPALEPVRWLVVVESDQREWRLERNWAWQQHDTLRIVADPLA